MTDVVVGSGALLASFFFISIMLLRVLTLDIVAEDREAQRRQITEKIGDFRTEVSLADKLEWPLIFDRPLAIDLVPSRTRNPIALHELFPERAQSRRSFFL